MNQLNSGTSKILLTTDFSEASRKAFSYALAQAKSPSSKLEIVNVLEGPSIPVALYEYLPTPEEIDRLFSSAREKAQEQLNQIAKKDFKEVQSSVKLLQHYGSSADSIVKYASEGKFNLIVIATHGHGIVGRIMLGSVAERVLRDSSCPVLVVPCHAEDNKNTRSHLPCRKILVTTDFSPAALAAFRVAESQAKQSKAQLSLGYVVESPFAPELFDETTVLSGQSVESLQQKYHSGLKQHLQEYAKQFGTEVTPVLIEKTYSVSNSLSQYAQENQIDLIVIATRGVGNRLNWIGGAVERLVRQAPCPVLVVPSHS